MQQMINVLRTQGLNDKQLLWVQDNFYNFFCPDWSEMSKHEFTRLTAQVKRCAIAGDYVA